jgi:hypothetical protein
MKNPTGRLQAILIILTLLLVIGSVSAQDQEMTEPLDLSGQPIVLEFSVGPTGPPTIEPLADGRVLFKINPAGPVTGDLVGTMSSAVTEVNPHPSPIFQPISITFTIETDQGSLDGYYAGTIFVVQGAELVAHINGHGRILSVDAAYADLFLADVFVTSQVQFSNGQGTGESGTMTITARH